jgi:hypothetical protein
LPSELEEAIKEFESNYSQFLNKNQKYVLIDDQLEINFLARTKTSTVEDTAAAFGERLRKIQHVSDRKGSLTEKKWTRQVEQFFHKLYPVTRLACGFTAFVAEVLPPNFGFRISDNPGCVLWAVISNRRRPWPHFADT